MLHSFGSKQRYQCPLRDWTEDNGRYFLIMERMQGKTLKEAWPDMSQSEREGVAQQVATSLRQFRGLQSPKIQNVGDSPVYSAFLFQIGHGRPHGPLGTDDELWKEMSKALTAVPDDEKARLRQRMPPAEPYTFTHGDLATVNLIVDNGQLVGFLDWEASGYFPVWWEYVAMTVAQDEGDREWKTLLQGYMDVEYRSIAMRRAGGVSITRSAESAGNQHAR